MANYTAADVKKLRELTAAGMMDCKRALEEADGDFPAAVDILRVKGAKDVDKRSGRVAANGLVAASGGAMLELNCETDFVAKSERFVELGRQVLDQALSAKAASADDLLDSEIEPGKTVRQLLDDANVTLGEKIEVRRVARLATHDGVISSYLHKTSPDLPAQIGVLVATHGGAAEVGRDIAMHIAALSPSVLHRDEISAETVENERRVAEATAREEGKPDAALPRIVDGRVNGYFKENVLLEQSFAKDAKKTVAQVLKESGGHVIGFARFRVGS